MKTYNTLDELKRALDLRRVIELITGRKVLRSRINCPFHEDHNPSFSIYKYNDHYRYKCHSNACGRSGDVFNFIQSKLGYDNISQVLNWIDTNRIELHLESTFDLSVMLGQLGENYEKQKFWKKVENICRKCLLEGEGSSGCNWLRSRGVLEPAIAFLPVGYFSVEYLNRHGVTRSELDKHGLDISELFEKGSIAYFYYATPSDLSRIKLRIVNGPSIGKHDPQVFIAQELSTETGFFGLNLQATAYMDRLVLVEGEMDVLVPQSMALVDLNEPTNVICQSGSAAIQELSLDLLHNMGVRQLAIWPDNDKGGQEFVERFAKQTIPAGMVLRVQWPEDYVEGEDPAVYYARYQQLMDVSPFLRKEMDGPTIWLAKRASEEYGKIENPTDTDFRNLRTRVVEIGVEASLRGFVLDDYLDFACKTFPGIRKDSLRFEIQNSRASRTVQVIGDRVFMVKSDGYYVRRVNKEEVRWTPISNFVINYQRIIQFLDDENYSGNTDASIEADIVLDGQHHPILLSMENFSRFDNFMSALRTAIPAGMTYDPSIFRTYYDPLLNSFNYDVQKIEGYNTLGLNNTKYILPQWYVEDGVVEPNIKYFLSLPDQFTRMYDTKLQEDITLQKKAAALIVEDMLQLAIKSAQHIPLFLLGHIAAAPLVEMLNLHPGALYIEGRFQAGKSTICQLFMNLVANYPLGRGNVSIQSTPNYIEMVFNRFCGLPVFLDDVKRDILRGSARTQFLRLIQGYHDRQGRGRLTRNIRTRPMAYVRGHLVMCGENLPTEEGSALSRMLILDVNKGDINLTRAHKIAKQRACLSSIWPYYIAWLQKNASKLNLNEEYSSGVENNKSRLDYFINYIGTALECFLTFLHEEYNIDKKYIAMYCKRYKKGALTLVRDNRELQESKESHLIFVETLETLLDSGQFTLGEVLDMGHQRIGYREDDTVYIYPALAINAVEKYVDKSFSRHTLTKILSSENYLIGAGEIRRRKTLSTKRDSVWAFKAEKLFQTFGDPRKRNQHNDLPLLREYDIPE